MGLLLITLIPMVLFSIWSFAHLSPKKTPNKQLIYAYNTLTLLIILSVCILYGFNTRANMMNSPDSNWWLIIWLLGSLFIFSIGMVTGTFIRLLIFGRN